MSTPAKIAIFAGGSTAKGSYLAEIVKLAGYDPVENLMDSPIVLAAENLSFSDKQVVPAFGQKAATVIDRLHKAVRAMEARPASLSIGPYRLETREGLWYDASNEAIKLTEKEVALLVFLKSCDGKPVSRQSLLENVWSYVDGIETHTLETHIYRLRQKIEPDPSNPVILVTEGDGYKLLG